MKRFVWLVKLSISLFLLILTHLSFAVPISEMAWIKAQQIRNQALLPNANSTQQHTEINYLSEARTKEQFMQTVQNIIQPQATNGINSGIKPPVSSVLIFVSLSMPILSLRAWMLEATKIHAPVILRGLVNNNFTDTEEKIHTVLGTDIVSGFQIDPLWFKQFTIVSVPAVVVRGDAGFDVVYGDVGLSSALKTISLHGVNAKDIAQKLIQGNHDV